MGSYSVRFKPSVEKDLRHLPQGIAPRVMIRIESLRDNPFPHGCAKFASSEKMYRLRVGAYRIVYEVDPDTRTVTVHYVRHRREVYRGI